MLRLATCFAFALVLVPATSHAFNAGAPGYSGKTAGMTCSGCHSGTAAPTVTFSGPSSLAAGAVGEYSITVTGAGAAAKTGGVDVATDATDAVLAAGSTTVQVVQ